MDLIAELSSKLGLEPNSAQALAGALLGSAQSQIEQQVGKREGAQMAEAIPELESWKQKALTLLGGASEQESKSDGGMLGGALGALTGGSLSGALGGALSALSGTSGDSQSGSIAAVTALLSKLNLSPSVISTAAPLVLSFLESRLPPEWVSKAKAILPLLSGGSGDLGSLLGGFLKS